MHAYTTHAHHARYAAAARPAYRYQAIPQVAPPPMPRYRTQVARPVRPAAMRRPVQRTVAYAQPMPVRFQQPTPVWQSVNQFAASAPSPVPTPANTPAPAGKPIRGGLDRKLYSVLFFFAFWMILSCLFVGYYVARSI